MITELFQIQESLSPRLKWIAKHGVKTNHCRVVVGYPWCAWLAKDDQQGMPSEEAFENDRVCYGDTEIEAVEWLAASNGAINWIDR